MQTGENSIITVCITYRSNSYT